MSSGRLGNGVLRQRVARFLAASPGSDFSPGEIARALGGRSAGAVGNALDVLTGRGQARLCQVTPRRYRATASTAAAGDTPTATPAAVPAAAAPAVVPAAAAAGAAGAAAAVAAAGVAGAVVSGPVARPNGQLYQPRLLSGLPDVTVLRRLRAAGVPALLYGPPGTGKTSLIEAAFADLVTVAGDGDTTVGDLCGEYTQTPEGKYHFVHGPLVVAMLAGRCLFLDDATLIPPTVLAVVYPAMDGRREITVKANGGQVVTAADGFYVVAGHNPGVHGAVLTDALSSRFSAHIAVSTDYDLATQLEIDRRAVRVARNLATRQVRGEIGWAPQLRELLAFQRIAAVLGPMAAAANLVGGRARARPGDRRLGGPRRVRRAGHPPSPRCPHHRPLTPQPTPPAVHPSPHPLARHPLARTYRRGHPTMSGHVITDDTITPTPPPPSTSTGAGWLALCAALADQVPPIAERDDLLVRIWPGAGHGAPACFLPAHAVIELDGTHLGGIDPGSADPQRVADRARYPALWGLLVHECAHARHSRWHTLTTPATGAGAAALAAAMLLEESRIEAAHIRRRPDDRHWLRASASGLILREMTTTPLATPPNAAARAARAAALLLARVDAGVLTTAETAPLTEQVQTILGTETLARLRDIWRAAHTTTDTDTDTMTTLGRRWCDTLATHPATDHTEPATEPAEDSAGSVASPLREAITRSLSALDAAVATEATPATGTGGAPADPDPTLAAERRAGESAARAASEVFDERATRAGASAGPYTRITGTRAPRSAERAAARRLGRALSTAGIRERVAVRTDSMLPPGRLRMRGALAADAQRAAGAIPTAAPFTRTTRRITPAPPLRVGIACDVSGSMYAVAGPVASAAWILAQATGHTSVAASCATVIFGNHVRAITSPATPSPRVTEFATRDSWENLPLAIEALDGMLGLATPGAARLLVIVSDGDFRSTVARESQTRLDRLRAAGCRLLWLAPTGSGLPATPLNGATVHPLTDPSTTAEAIGRAATQALRATR